MRVISGKYKRSNLIGFDIDGTRPTMDRVKESMFAMIQNYIKDSVCLDLFAGTGALGIEAISNGAKKCYFVDKNKIAINTIKANISKLQINEEIVIIQNDFKEALTKITEEVDLILLDPPYGKDFISESLDKIRGLKILSSDGIIVCESEDEDYNYFGFEIIKEKQIKTKLIRILKKL